MAHFARIENGIVQQVIVVNNDLLLDEDGLEQEIVGIEFCQSLFGADSEWVQTSYTEKMRGRFAGIGMTWNGEIFQ